MTALSRAVPAAHRAGHVRGSREARALAAAVGDHTAALSPRDPGEDGVRRCRAHLRRDRDVCRARDAVIADEVQSGLGRTGYPFPHARAGPDLSRSEGPRLWCTGRAALVSEKVALAISAATMSVPTAAIAATAAAFFLEQLMTGIARSRGQWSTLRTPAGTLASASGNLEVRGAGSCRASSLARCDGVVDQARQNGLLSIARTRRSPPASPLTIEAADIDRASIARRLAGERRHRGPRVNATQAVPVRIGAQTPRWAAEGVPHKDRAPALACLKAPPQNRAQAAPQDARAWCRTATAADAEAITRSLREPGRGPLLARGLDEIACTRSVS